MILINIRCSRARLAYRYTHQAPAFQAFTFEGIGWQRFRSQQKSRVSGNLDLTMHADLLQHLHGSSLPHGHCSGAARAGARQPLCSWIT
jgi:hypothetical protein